VGRRLGHWERALEDARGAADELRRILGARGPAERLFNLRVLPFLIEALVRSGDQSGAAAALEELELTAGASEYRAARAALGHAAGLVRHTAQDLETAAAEWRAIEQPFEEGQALADLANELPERDGATRAALDIFERLGSRLGAERARGLLRRAGVRPSRTPAAQRATMQDHGLTPREMEVLSQLVKGQTNREIARSRYRGEDRRHPHEPHPRQARLHHAHPGGAAGHHRALDARRLTARQAGGDPYRWPRRGALFSLSSAGLPTKGGRGT
jgi:ATP/maltotriose-dependent transcriptional regulator MalT